MKCPKCGQARPLRDQVCRRCKYVFDEDRFLELALPRAGSKSAPKKFFTAAAGIDLQDFISRPWVPPAASILPGLGHYLQGKRWLALAYFTLVLGLIGLSVSLFSQTSGQMLLGLAVSTHATCILDTTPWGRSREAMPRVLGMAGLLTGLMVLYWPLLDWLARTFVPAGRREYERGGPRVIRGIGFEQIAVMILLYAVSIAVSTWITRRLASRET
ncbi:MAG TPA: hypothetical protein VM222_04915 [Planctomycetota bacterium]|nr:hypothetical protein [Planctomycetota bacterium]